ncbi:MAG: NAD(+)/NADH kinase [Clostridia bacterium]|nr:NAD(+)/NADH kinase [Clostridia bacterium]
MKKIGIIVNTQKDDNDKYLNRVLTALSGRAEVYISDSANVSSPEITKLSNSDLAKTVEYMIVLGGDGTIIGAASMCARNKVPVMGINLGRIGFMTEVECDAIDDAIDALLSGNYKTERRMMMKAQIKKDGKAISTCHALNDIVVSKSAGVKLVGIDLYTNDELVNRYIADGIIIATPTGSTGYSISAGGPVVDPMMNLYVATPVCAHMLSVRSAILSADKDIVIKLTREYADNKALVSADGEVQSEIGNSDEVIISRSQYSLELIKIGNQSFYDTLLKKLS